MPSQDWIKKHGVNPFAIANARGVKGAKRERMIEHIVAASEGRSKYLKKKKRRK